VSPYFWPVLYFSQFVSSNPGQPVSVQIVCWTQILRNAIIWKRMTVKTFTWYGKRIKLHRIKVWRVGNGQKFQKRKKLNFLNQRWRRFVRVETFYWNNSLQEVLDQNQEALQSSSQNISWVHMCSLNNVWLSELGYACHTSPVFINMWKISDVFTRSVICLK